MIVLCSFSECWCQKSCLPWHSVAPVWTPAPDIGLLPRHDNGLSLCSCHLGCSRCHARWRGLCACVRLREALLIHNTIIHTLYIMYSIMSLYLTPTNVNSQGQHSSVYSDFVFVCCFLSACFGLTKVDRWLYWNHIRVDCIHVQAAALTQPQLLLIQQIFYCGKSRIQRFSKNRKLLSTATYQQAFEEGSIPQNVLYLLCPIISALFAKYVQNTSIKLSSVHARFNWTTSMVSVCPSAKKPSPEG